MNIRKTTKSEREFNSQTLLVLMYAFYDMNVQVIGRYLADNGVFMNKSKQQFLAWLNSQFEELKSQYSEQVTSYGGICEDYIPGADTLEIRYLLNPDFLDQLPITFGKKGSPAQEGEVVFRFAFEIFNGMVFRIARTKKYSPKPVITKDEFELNFN